jgi:hypothetical protein
MWMREDIPRKASEGIVIVGSEAKVEYAARLTFAL